MDYLSCAEIMESTLPEADIEIPEWGGTVKVRAITGSECARAKSKATNQRTKDLDEIKFNALLMVAGCVEPEFPPASEEQLMRKIAAGPVARIAARIIELSGLGDQDEDDDQGEA